VQGSYIPSLGAAVALERKNPNRAIELLGPAGRLDFGGGFGLFQNYLRGEANLALRDGKAAAAEFQKFVDHRGAVGADPVGALARLGLARAYALEAQTARGTEGEAARAKARAAYQDFLTLWKDADTDVPILKQAKAESAGLK